MKLYLLHLCKGKQDFKIGENVKDFLDWIEDFKDKKLLDWGVDFEREITDAHATFQRTKQWGKEKNINECFVICTASGTIRGILPINENSKK